MLENEATKNTIFLDDFTGVPFVASVLPEDIGVLRAGKEVAWFELRPSELAFLFTEDRLADQMFQSNNASKRICLQIVKTLQNHPVVSFSCSNLRRAWRKRDNAFAIATPQLAVRCLKQLTPNSNLKRRATTAGPVEPAPPRNFAEISQSRQRLEGSATQEEMVLPPGNIPEQ